MTKEASLRYTNRSAIGEGVMEEKSCRICGVTKPLDEFHRTKARPDGRHSACKPCAIAQQLASMGRKPKADKLRWAPEGMKVCVHCGKTRKHEAFPRNRHAYDGRHHTCKACMKPHQPKHVPGANREQNRKRYWAAPEVARDRRISSNHGIPTGTYEKLLAMQGGGCAVCGATENHGKTRFAFDHCHASGRIRGLLCTRCNQAIGQMRDSPMLLRKAARYLESPPAADLGLVSKEPKPSRRTKPT